MRTFPSWLAGVALAVAVLLPPAAVKATEFSLGGYVALYVLWDSTQVNTSMSELISRNNDPNLHHGRLKLSAERGRISFTLKGPQLWGAQTNGFIEFDFDGGGGQQYSMVGGGWSSINKPRARVRHAMFRLNWPETELLMGLYFSLISEDAPEQVRPTLSGIPGILWYREPQIRVNQKILGVFDLAVAIANPGGGPDSIQTPGDQTATNTYLGESSETPRLSGRIRYEQDLWGKAAYYGVPRGFAARLAATWQRTRYQVFVNNGLIFGENNFVVLPVAQRNQQYLNPWAVDGSLFIPLLTTSTANLSRTLSLLTHWYVGAGVDLEKEATPANSSYLIFDTVAGGTRVGARQLAKQFGGIVQLQYYFTNQWYMNAIWGMNRVFNVDLDRWMGTTTGADPAKIHQHCYLDLWYRPIQALKFGLEYGYACTNYFQKRQSGTQICDVGENHRLVFMGFLFF